jgi:hypothetical protein
MFDVAAMDPESGLFQNLEAASDVVGALIETG